MGKFKIKSFCKINLSLNVSKKIINNYHQISTLITFCNICDILTIQKIKGTKDKIDFIGKYKKNINIASNTVTNLLKLLRKKNFLKNQAFNICVEKNIPHGSGLGGGSSNAAALLNFFNKNMILKLNTKNLNKIALQIGSDVPIALKKKNTFFNGKKNEITRINKKFGLIILIAYPNVNCSTKMIYKKNKHFSTLKAKINVSKRKELINHLINENNDLQKTVIKYYPKVRKLIKFIEAQNGCYFSRITGSGSACFGIFSNIKKAIYAKKLLNMKFSNYWSVVSKTI
jgi:4-diphosphocytidyl-2-C-methyl-D-erythritol kinase